MQQVNYQLKIKHLNLLTIIRAPKKSKTTH